MPLINQESLKSFLSGNHYLTNTTAPEGLEQAIKQAEDLIYQKTHLLIPADITKAIPTLQYIAHSIIVWMTKGQQDSIDMWVYQYLKNLYDKAMQMLDDIASGKMELYDNDGNLVQLPFKKTSTYYANADGRSERL